MPVDPDCTFCGAVPCAKHYDPKSSAWSDTDRERADDTAAVSVDHAVRAAQAADEMPAWFGAFRPGTIFHQNGWWCRVRGIARTGDGAPALVVVPEKPTKKEEKRTKKLGRRVGE